MFIAGVILYYNKNQNSEECGSIAGTGPREDIVLVLVLEYEQESIVLSGLENSKAFRPALASCFDILAYNGALSCFTTQSIIWSI
ncbi:hypothetical protein SDJN03_06773, partial [Cucurbita argyrosperma subsp. sororia]